MHFIGWTTRDNLAPSLAPREMCLAMSVEHTTFTWTGGTVSGIWNAPTQGNTYLLLGHGAGGTLQTPALAKFAETLASRGVGAVRFNFPYAEQRRKVPDRQATLEACYRDVANHAAERASQLFLGGRSMGGRIASHLVAAGYPGAGLVFLGSPLHPPGKPERMRDAHLEAIAVPMLFLQGSRDAFARPDLLAQTVARLPRATLHIVEGGDHSMTVRGRPVYDTITELVVATITWIESME